MKDDKRIVADAVALAIWAGLTLLAARPSNAGSWVQVANSAPGSVQLMLLLTDGTVMCSDGGNGAWYKFTPDSSGNYLNASPTTLAPMNFTRRYFSSQVLRDGRVFVAGAEYGTGTNSAEIYTPWLNSWTILPMPPGLASAFFDSASILLPDGSVLIAPVNPAPGVGTVIYNPVANSWGTNVVLRNQNEASWVKLPDNSILTVDKSSTTSERFIPSLGRWIKDADVPVNLYDANSEIGPGLLLPDGRAFYLGASGATAFYTPSGDTNRGNWAPGLPIPNGQGCVDAPAVMLTNGNVLFACSPVASSGNNYPNNVSFYEYDPINTNYARQNSPTGGQTHNNIPVYQTSFLGLPDGRVLYSFESPTLYVYQPGSHISVAGVPVIYGVSWRCGACLHLIGTGFNGLSQGAAYGDDEQMDSNYPLVRFGDNNGHLYYGRSYNWSDTGVQTGNKTVATEVMPPWDQLAPGPYPITVVANGIGSSPFWLASPTWVDFNHGGSHNGSFTSPYSTLAAGRDNVPTGGTIIIKAGHHAEALSITKAMTIVAYGGDATDGQ